MKNVWIGLISLTPALAFADHCPFNEAVGTYRVTNVTCTGVNCPAAQELENNRNLKLEVYKKPNTDGPNIYGHNPSSFVGWSGLNDSDIFYLDEEDKLLKIPSSRSSPYVEKSCVQKKLRNMKYRVFSWGQKVNEPIGDGKNHLFTVLEVFTQNLTLGTYQLSQTAKDNIMNYDYSIDYTLEKITP